MISVRKYLYFCSDSELVISVGLVFEVIRDKKSDEGEA